MCTYVFMELFTCAFLRLFSIYIVHVCMWKYTENKYTEGGMWKDCEVFLPVRRFLTIGECKEMFRSNWDALEDVIKVRVRK